MLKLVGNFILYHDDIPYGEITYDNEVTLNFTDKPLTHGELLDLIEILRDIETKI